MALYDPAPKPHAALRSALSQWKSLPAESLNRVVEMLTPEDDGVWYKPAEPLVLAELALGLLDLRTTATEQFGMATYKSALSSGGDPYSSHRVTPDCRIPRYENAPELEAEILDCGTVACAVGWAPRILRVPGHSDEGWTDYRIRVLGSMQYDAFYYMFGAGWAEIDNTPQGAAARIQTTLALALSSTSKPEFIRVLAEDKTTYQDRLRWQNMHRSLLDTPL